MNVQPPLAMAGFDVLLALLLPLAIILVGRRLSPSFSWSDILALLSLNLRKNSGSQYFSLERANTSYTQFARMSAEEQSRMLASYTTLGRAHRNLGRKIGYPQKLDQLRDVTALSATVAESIAELASEEFPSLSSIPSTDVSAADLARVRESLKHFIRDWSEEGAPEREQIFTPILDLLKEVDADERAKKKVLVPGSGLGRLAWEISQLGFATTANELSFFMTLAFRFLLSPKTTATPNEHHLRPYAHWFSHQRSNASTFRRISFPDVIPRLGPNLTLVEKDFLTLSSPSASPLDKPEFWTKSPTDSGEGYDFIVTLFFIDTSINVFATMEHIFKLLRPGGSWINLGPLLWTGGGQSKIELSLEEVLQAAEEIGFVIQRDDVDSSLEAMKTVECQYTGDRNAMMCWTYKAEFWVARKFK